MSKSISNTDDIIDSRDVIARIRELEAERDHLKDEMDEAAECVRHHHDGELDEAGKYPEHDEYRRCRDEFAEFETGDDGAELAALLALQDEAEGYAPDWRHGAALIRDSYFTEYAQQLAEDIGAINPDASWPNDCIDWDKAAEQLQMDYTQVDFDGEAYWIR